MTLDDWVVDQVKNVLTRRLVKNTGITEVQARELVDRIGPHWPELVREAQTIRNQQ
jgi:hypothetical protein